MSKGVSEWFWIAAGIIAGLVIFTIAYSQIAQISQGQAEQVSISQFEELENSYINNLCWSSPQNVRPYTVDLTSTVNGIYASSDKYTSYSKDQLVNFILSGKNQTGNYFCIDVQNKRLRCDKLYCNVTMPFIGAVPENNSLSALINQLSGKSTAFSYTLNISKASSSVIISILNGTIPTTTTISRSTTTTTTPPFDFSISVSPTSGTVNFGLNSISTTAIANVTSGTSVPVSFNCSTPISGLSCSLATASCTPNCTSTVTIYNSNAAQRGQYSINITANSSTVTKNVTYTLKIV